MSEQVEYDIPCCGTKYTTINLYDASMKFNCDKCKKPYLIAMHELWSTPCEYGERTIGRVTTFIGGE